MVLQAMEPQQANERPRQATTLQGVAEQAVAAMAVNLCESPEMIINYNYKDIGRQMMILYIGAPVSIAGVSWMTQYLREFGLNIEEIKSTKCNQPFVFGPS